MNTTKLVEALVAKVGRMKPIPKIEWGQWNTVPGEKWHTEDTHYTISEDKALSKLDKLILKALKVIKQESKTDSPLKTLLEAAAEVSAGKGMHSTEFLVFSRVMEDSIQMDAFRRIRSNETLDKQDIIYYGVKRDVVIANLASALRGRGLLKKAKNVSG